jgi:tetratricopeptide (TPR) repeat protein
VNLLFSYLFLNPRMINRYLKSCILIMLPFFTGAQAINIDSLVQLSNIAQNDTIKLIRVRTIARSYAELNPDSAYHYSEASLKLARKLKLKLDEGSALQEIAYAYLNKGNYPRSLQIFLSALVIIGDSKTEQNVLVGKFPGDDALFYRTATPHLQRLSGIAFIQQNLGILYANSNN